MSPRTMEDDTDIAVSIFKVPESLSKSNPEAYVPQLIGLGPYHHSREELKPMHTFKLSQVKKIFNTQFPRNEIRDFDMLVRLLRALGMAYNAHACYAVPIDIKDDVLVSLIIEDRLVRLMAIDSLYLLELLRRYVDEDYDDRDGSGFFCDLVSFGAKGNKSPWEIAAGDLTMLENQIPIHSLKLILTTEHWEAIEHSDKSKRSVSVVTENLPQLLLRFVAELSPLSVFKDYPLYKVLRHSHLLELLYCLVTLETLPEPSPKEEEEEAKSVEKIAKKVWLEISSHNGDLVVTFGVIGDSLMEYDVSQSSIHGEIFSPIWNLLLDTLLLPLKIPVKLIQGLIGLPWSKIWLYISNNNGRNDTESEILITPGASELHKKGVTFCPIDRISGIKFDKNALSFQIPSIKLDHNSEIVLRNLVAYEAAVKWKKRDSLVLARYLELMSVLAKSCDDVKTLIDSTIIKTSSSSSSSLKEEEVLELFAAMTKPVRGTNTKDIDEAVSEVVGYYNSLGTVSALRFVKKWGFIVLHWCSVFGILLALLVLIFVAIRSVYEWLFNSKDNFLVQLQGML